MQKYNFIDADTMVVQSTVIEQYNYMIYKDGEKVGPCQSKKQWSKDFTETFLDKLTPDNGILPDGAEEKAAEALEKELETIEFRQEASLKGGRLTPLNRAIATFKKKIREVENRYGDHIHFVCIEGEGNYRDDLYPNYKAQRQGEIILRERLSEWIKENWPKDKLIVAEGHETDDEVALRMWMGHKYHEKHGEWVYMISSCDKDLRTVAGKNYNYCKKEEQIITELEADRWFCTQLLYGDKVDNIKGINFKLPKEFLHPFGIRATAGKVGEKTAERLLEHCETSKECFQKVVDCYKEAHGDRWLMCLQEEALALRMCHTRAEMETGSHYQIRVHLEHLGIDCE